MRTLPVLTMKFPRAVVALHQIEIESRCNLRCRYCPSPTLGRPKVSMAREHYLAALAHVRYYVRQGTQHELNLAGIGESTMHPEFVDFVRLAREAVGDHVKLVFATNGLICSPDLVRALSPYRVRVWVSLHRPEKAALAVDLYRAAGMLEGVSTDPSTNANDWAGQVAWMNSPGNRIPCPWMRQGHMMAMADGRLTTCCLDATGVGVIGHVDDIPGMATTAPYVLCRTCYQDIGVAGWDQAKGEPCA